jgi:putative heme-binding domain-containing protein
MCDSAPVPHHPRRALPATGGDSTFNPYTNDDIKTIAKHRHYLGGTPHGGNGKSDSAGGGHAHAGAMIYLGGRWPEKYRDQIFMNNIHGARLNMDALAPQGSGYVGDRAPDFLLTNDVWSQILYLTYGPDGNVYMIDWYDRNQCHHGNVPGHDRSNGRIFKISYTGTESKAVSTESGRAGIHLAKPTSVMDLVAAQRSDNDFDARHALRRMRELTAKIGQPIAMPDASLTQAVAALEQQAFEHPDEAKRLRGLWSLDALGALTDARLLQALENDSAYVRAWAIQLGTAPARGSLSEPLLKKLVEMAIHDESPVVRLYLASACQKLTGMPQATLIGELIQHAEDALDTNLPFLYWYAAESVAAADPQTGLKLVGLARIPMVKGYLIRRLVQTNDPSLLNQLVATAFPTAKTATEQLLVLKEITEGLRGRRQVPMPDSWGDLYQRLSSNEDAAVRSLALNLALIFGDPQALLARQKTLANPKADMADRLAALDALLIRKSANLAPTLQHLLTTKELAGAALRGLALYDDPQTPTIVIGAYAGFDQSQRRDAVNTLASRPAYALALLNAVEQKKIVAADLSGDLIRQMRSLKNAEVDGLITKVWGISRDTPEEKAKLITSLKTMLQGKPVVANRPDVSLGRAVFAKTCQQCHTLFGTGARTGPELTGSNRANLDYALSNIVDPSALIGKDYQAQVITTTAGRTLNGLIKAEDVNAITLVTANETVIIPKSEIDERAVSDKSMMPDDILKPLSEREIRSLIAYLASPVQVPLAVTANSPVVLFNGKDLAGWTGNHRSVERRRGRNRGTDRRPETK